MRVWIAAIAACAAMCLAGCDQKALMASFTPQEEVALTQSLVTQLAARDFSTIEAIADPDAMPAHLRGTLEQMADLLPREAPKSITTVGAHTHTHKPSDTTTYNLSLEYEYAASWMLVTTQLQRRGDKLLLQGIHFFPRTQSLEAEHRFALEGKGALHYLVLAWAVVVPLFIVITLVVSVRTRIPKRKWLWLLFVAVGLVQFQFNWSNGAWNLQPVAFNLLGVGVLKSGAAAPWIFTLTLPIGAVVFWFKRKVWLREQGGHGDGAASPALAAGQKAS